MRSSAFFIGIFIGTVAVIVCVDRRFIYILVSQHLIQTFPLIGKCFANCLSKNSRRVSVTLVFRQGKVKLPYFVLGTGD